jgi:hypothetical protein
MKTLLLAGSALALLGAGGDAPSYPPLCEFDDHIRRDIGLIRDALPCEASRPSSA